MTLHQANTQLQAIQSPLRITRNVGTQRHPWVLQLGDHRGALTFPTLDAAVRYAAALAPRDETPRG